MAAPAWKAAQDIAEGFLTINVVSLKRYEPHEMNSLQQELDKISREVRSTAVAQDDVEAAQGKNRKLLRVSQALQVLQAYRGKIKTLTLGRPGPIGLRPHLC